MNERVWRVWRVFKLSLTFGLDCHAWFCNTLYLPSQNTPALESLYTSSSLCPYYAPEMKLVSVRCWAHKPDVCTLSDIISTKDWPVAHERINEIPFGKLGLHGKTWHKLRTKSPRAKAGWNEVRNVILQLWVSLHTRTNNRGVQSCHLFHTYFLLNRFLLWNYNK
jgi:hypothetical protein